MRFAGDSIDNLLRPILVGKRLKLHTLLAFISVVGGLILFGASGLILGPVALTVTTERLEIWHPRALDLPAVAANSTVRRAVSEEAL